MSSDPNDPLRKRGRALARKLDEFVRAETATREEAGQVLLGALQFLEQQTVMLRRPNSPWPDPDERQDPPEDDR